MLDGIRWMSDGMQWVSNGPQCGVAFAQEVVVVILMGSVAGTCSVLELQQGLEMIPCAVPIYGHMAMRYTHIWSYGHALHPYMVI